MPDEITRMPHSSANPSVLRKVVKAVAIQLVQARGDAADAYSDEEIQAATDRLLSTSSIQRTPARGIDTLDVDTLGMALTIAGRIARRDSIDLGLTPAGRGSA